MQQAKSAGRELRELIGDGNIYVFHSPYIRVVQTTKEILNAFSPSQILYVREEPRISEQQFGNRQDPTTMKRTIAERLRFGRFFYRFPDGEAGLDVYTRVSVFIGTLRQTLLGPKDTVIIVTHGLAIRLFLMRWFQWTVDQFEETRTPGCCQMAVLERMPGQTGYRLTPSSLKAVGADTVHTTSAYGRSVYTKAFVDAFLTY